LWSKNADFPAVCGVKWGMQLSVAKVPSVVGGRFGVSLLL
jgi:hypothetical protein